MGDPEPPDITIQRSSGMPFTGRRPHRVTARTLGLSLSALLAAALLAWSPTSTSAWNRSSAEATLWQLLNGARVNNGLAPLQSHGTLVSLARWRSSDMLARDYFSHTIPGCGCLVYAYYDSNGLQYSWAGENIAWNSGRTDDYSPVRAHEQFMGSPGHRANVLDGRFTHGGVGAAAADNQMFQGYVQNTRMYTQLFMQAKTAAAPAPAPAPAPPPAAPAPPPSGGGGSTAPARTAPAPTATPEPQPKVISVGTPARPTSSAGLDRVATRISATVFVVDLAARLTIEERSAERAALLAVVNPAVAAATTDAPEAEVVTLEVQAPAAPEPGFLETIVGALVGFLFG